MKKSIFFILSLAVLYTSCSNHKKDTETNAAKGNKVYGGTLRLSETDKSQILYPISIIDVLSRTVATQIYEGLVKFDPKDLSIIPSIAEKWDLNAAGTTYTFHLRKGIHFHDDACFPEGKGRELKAADVAYSFELLCTDSKENLNFPATFKGRVVGADKFYAANKGKPSGTVEGIKVIDDYTVEITLTAPSSSFLYALALPATSIIAREAVEKDGTDMHVGTGPFVFTNSGSPDITVLKRNKSYHGYDSDGNQLPFLDSIIITYLPSKKQELENFQNGKLSMVSGLPSESVKEMVEKQISDFQNKSPKFVLYRSPEMSTQYYEFNLNKTPFNNVKVRQAFSYAIDRNRIIEQVLKGEASGPGIHGISSPALKGYDISKITGYNFDPAKAKKLLEEAGYPNGKGFPKIKIELNSGGLKHTSVVAEIQKQLLDVLNINVDFEVVSYQQKLENSKFARADILRNSWVADFPSPENFLWILYGASVPASLDVPSYPNTSRYKNPEYDKLFEAGRAAKTQSESFANFLKAEELMMKDAPVMVLWYEENYNLKKSDVQNFYFNPMLYKDYSQVYLKNPDTSANTTETGGGNEEKK